MRDLTKDECLDLYAGICPLCKSTSIVPGPRGAAAQNVDCEGCGAGFNRVAAEVVARVWGEPVLWGQQIREPRRH